MNHNLFFTTIICLKKLWNYKLTNTNKSEPYLHHVAVEQDVFYYREQFRVRAIIIAMDALSK